jgi:hypothetical protein
VCLSAPPAEWNVRHYGAAGDGRTLDTVPIQNALDDCLRFGGGRVLLPPGVYLSGTLNLRSHVRLVLAEGAILRGSPNLHDYVEPLARNSTDHSHFVATTGSRRLFLNGDHVRDAAIEGSGTIDGARLREPNGDRGPLSVFFQHSTGVTLQGVTVTNSPGWSVTFFDCTDVRILNTRLLNVMVDGIDPVSCQRVLCDGVVIDGTGDDPICLKNEGPPLPGGFRTQGIHIRNTVVRNTNHPAVKIGTGSNGTFDDILVEDCSFHLRGGIFAIQLMRPNQPGETDRHIRNVTLRRIQATSAGRLLDVTTMGVNSPVIRGLNFEDIRLGGAPLPSRIHGTDVAPIRQVAIRRLQVESESAADCLLSLRHVEGLELSGLQLKLAAPTLFRLFETSGATFSAIAASPVATLATISGIRSRNVRFDGPLPSGLSRPLIVDPAVPAGALLPVAEPTVTALLLPARLRPNQPIPATARLHNPGPAGAVRLPLLVDGREMAALWTWLGAGQQTSLQFSAEPLYRPGRHRASAASTTRVFRLQKTPAAFGLREPCQVEWPRTPGARLRILVPVRNLGGTPGAAPITLESQGRPVLSQRVTAAPGEEKSLVFEPPSGLLSFRLPGFPGWPYATYRNVPGRFLFYRDRIAIEAGGRARQSNDYAAVYMPAVEGDFDAQVRVLSASEDTGDYSPVGLIVRNRIDDTSSPGLVTHFRVPKYGGYKTAFWDADGDGVTDTRSDGGPSDLPVWYRLEKRGSLFRILSSLDGVNWRPDGAPGRREFTIRNAAPRQDVGFYTAAWNDHGRQARAEFDNFSVRRVSHP